MIRKTLLLGLAGFLLCSPALRAQDNNGGGTSPDGNSAEQAKSGDSPGPNRFWQATVGGGNFMVALDKITSISRHKYVLDGSVIVDEVTIDTVGQALARFYFFKPITAGSPGNAVQDLTDKARDTVDEATTRGGGIPVQNMVVKKYPDTTHAKSLEYRVQSEQELKSLYSSVQNAWESGKGRKFTAK